MFTLAVDAIYRPLSVTGGETGTETLRLCTAPPVAASQSQI